MGYTGKLHTWDFVTVGAYFAAVLGVGIYSMIRASRGTVGGYFLAGRFITWFPVGASLFASNIGSEHFIGLAGAGAAAGVGIGAFELKSSYTLMLMAHVFVPVYIASGVCTLPEYMKKRFGGQRICLYIAVLTLTLYIFTKISVNLYSGAMFIQQSLNWNIYIAVFLLLVITVLTTVTGGLTSVLYTDTLQTVVMIIGSLILTVLSFQKVGGYTGLYHKYMEAIPSSLNVTLRNGSAVYNTTCGLPRPDSWVMLREPLHSDIPWPGFWLGQTTTSVWYWCADQMMVQRTLAAKSLSHAQGGAMFAGYIKVLPFFVIVLPGMISRVLFTDEVACADPVTCTEVCGNPIGCSNIAYPKLVLEVMPTGLRGLMMSVMLAALMSDLTSIFNSASTLFTMDMYTRVRKSAGTRELMIVGRLFVCLMAAFGIVWIPIIETRQGAQMFHYIQMIQSYLSPPIAAVFLFAVLWKRANEKGSFWGLMVGTVAGVARMAMDFMYEEPGCGEEDTRPLIMRIHYMYVALILFCITVVFIVIISLCTKPPTAKQLSRTTYFTRYDNTYHKEADTKEQPIGLISPDSGLAMDGIEPSTRADVTNDNVSNHHECDESTGNVSAIDPSSTSALTAKYKSGDVIGQDEKPSDSNLRRENRRELVQRHLLRYCCGVENAEVTARDTERMDKRMRHLTSLRQSRSARTCLYVGLVIQLIISSFCYAFFTAGSNAFGLIK